jgi:hypothetical protein
MPLPAPVTSAILLLTSMFRSSRDARRAFPDRIQIAQDEANY